MIKHIVISGGSVYGFVYYGILKTLIESDVIDVKDIQTIYATSAGCIIAVLLSLHSHIQEIDNYLINRPWQNVFEFTLQNILNTIQSNGMFDISIIHNIFIPVFVANDINITITMLEFFNKTNIELHFFSIKVQCFTVIDLSHKTHPHWTVMECIYASCCVPVLFQPFVKDNEIYTDGGFLCNCPLSNCLRENKYNDNDSNEKEIICINIVNNDVLKADKLSIVTYFIHIISNIISYNQSKEKHKNVYYIDVPQTDNIIFNMKNICASSKERQSLIDIGVELGTKFITVLNL